MILAFSEALTQEQSIWHSQRDKILAFSTGQASGFLEGQGLSTLRAGKGRRQRSSPPPAPGWPGCRGGPSPCSGTRSRCNTTCQQNPSVNSVSIAKSVFK